MKLLAAVVSVVISGFVFQSCVHCEESRTARNVRSTSAKSAKGAKSADAKSVDDSKRSCKNLALKFFDSLKNAKTTKDCEVLIADFANKSRIAKQFCGANDLSVSEVIIKYFAMMLMTKTVEPFRAESSELAITKEIFKKNSVVVYGVLHSSDGKQTDVVINYADGGICDVAFEKQPILKSLKTQIFADAQIAEMDSSERASIIKEKVKKLVDKAENGD